MTNLAIHWQNLKKEDPESVCKRSLASFAEGTYHLKFLSEEYLINLEKETISGPKGEAGFELGILLMIYLLNAKEEPFSNRWVSANELPNASGFFTGVHSFPVEKIVRRFSGKTEDFIKRCIELGGERIDAYPCAVSITPLPRIKVGFAYWPGGEEFPDKISVIFEHSCGFQMAPDAIWGLVRQVISVITKF